MNDNAVSLKLPTFWTAQPETWFTPAEAQFNLQGISASDTKYFHVFSALDQETATHLLDLVFLPPADGKYEELRDRLIATFGRSRCELATLSLHFHPLGIPTP